MCVCAHFISIIILLNIHICKLFVCYIFMDNQIIFQIKELFYKRWMLPGPKATSWMEQRPPTVSRRSVGGAPVSNPSQSQSFLPHSHGALPLNSRPLSWDRGFPISNSTATVFIPHKAAVKGSHSASDLRQNEGDATAATTITHTLVEPANLSGAGPDCLYPSTQLPAQPSHSGLWRYFIPCGILVRALSWYRGSIPGQGTY